MGQGAVAASDRLHRDVFPAEVTTPAGDVITGVRVFVTSTTATIWRAAPSAEGARAELLATIELEHEGSVPRDRATLPSNARIEVRSADGTYWVNKGRGCGCGSPLKYLGAPAPW